MAKREAKRSLAALFHNDDHVMLAAADAALKHMEMLPSAEYAIHEASPNAKGTGRKPAQDGIAQFPGNATPSPGTPGEGRGGGSRGDAGAGQTLIAGNPHPNPPPEYREREPESGSSRVRSDTGVVESHNGNGNQSDVSFEGGR
jgi:hypothetical protein